MKIILSEEQHNKIKLPRFIYKALITKNTSLGNNPVFPEYGEFGFEYDLIKTKYEQVDNVINSYIENGKLESKDTDYLLTILSKKIEECKKIEKPIKPQLEKLVFNIVNDFFSIPDETIILKCSLVNKITSKYGIRILPENDKADNTYTFEDVDELELTNKVILKRRFINSLIQGFSYWLSTDIDKWKQTVDGLNNELWGLWKVIIHITNYLLFTKKEEISDKNPQLFSYVEVNLGKKKRKTIIDAQGIIFPYLLRDTLRGLFELFSSHGLPEDNKKAMYIIRKADFLVAEPWDLRFGMAIMDVLKYNITKKYSENILTKTNKIPFLFDTLCSLSTEQFNSVFKNLFVGTNKGKRIINKINREIEHDIDYQKFKDRINQKNINASLISDGFFTKSELNDYVIEEDLTED